MHVCMSVHTTFHLQKRGPSFRWSIQEGKYPESPRSIFKLFAQLVERKKKFAGHRSSCVCLWNPSDSITGEREPSEGLLLARVSPLYSSPRAVVGPWCSEAPQWVSRLFLPDNKIYPWTAPPWAVSSPLFLLYFYFLYHSSFPACFVSSFFAMPLHQYLVSKYLVSTLLFLYCSARITCQFAHSPHSSSALAARRITWETSKRYPSPTAGQLSQNLRVRFFVKSFPDDTAVQPGLRNADFIDIN